MSRKRQKVSADGRSIATTLPIDQFHVAQQHDPDRESRKNRISKPRSLFVHSLPTAATSESLTEYFSELYAVKHATVVLDPSTKNSKGYGFITFADSEDAQRAKDHFDGSLFDGKKIKVDIAEPRRREIGQEQDGQRKSHPTPDALKTKAHREQQLGINQAPPRLIIRNLPWSIKTSDQLASLFSSYGTVKHAVLPQKNGRLSGFGFVEMATKHAEKALAEIDGKEIDGRILAVAYAVDKGVWEASKVDNPRKAPLTRTEHRSEELNFEDEDSHDEDVPQDENQELENSSDDRSEAEESEIDDDSAMEDSPKKQMQDNSSTIFIRNLPFTTSDDVLSNHFKSFGPVRYARVVMDPDTERSRGTGFVCFFNEDDCRNCLREAPKPQNTIPSANRKGGPGKPSILEDSDRSGGRFTLEGRVLRVSSAVSSEEAHRRTVEGMSLRNSRDNDKRRLYLLSEGTISSNSPLYAKLPPSEIKMREESAKQRQVLIKNNPTLNLSLTRLSIRNIPKNISSKELKSLAREAVVGFARDIKNGRRERLSNEELSRGGEDMKQAEKHRKTKRKGIVKQSKVVFEGVETGGKVDENTGAGRSRGYGFIEYSSHRWALMGLRWLNGHNIVAHGATNTPAPSSSSSRENPKRLIVEFAIENSQVVARRKEKEDKARQRSQDVSKAMENAAASRSTKKPLSKNTLMKRTRLGSKRKREAGAESDPSTKSAGLISDDKARAKLNKRQQIVGRKRAKRKARKG